MIFRILKKQFQNCLGFGLFTLVFRGEKVLKIWDVTCFEKKSDFQRYSTGMMLVLQNSREQMTKNLSGSYITCHSKKFSKSGCFTVKESGNGPPGVLRQGRRQKTRFFQKFSFYLTKSRLNFAGKFFSFSSKNREVFFIFDGWFSSRIWDCYFLGMSEITEKPAKNVIQLNKVKHEQT